MSADGVPAPTAVVTTDCGAPVVTIDDVGAGGAVVAAVLAESMRAGAVGGVVLIRTAGATKDVDVVGAEVVGADTA